MPPPSSTSPGDSRRRSVLATRSRSGRPAALPASPLGVPKPEQRRVLRRCRGRGALDAALARATSSARRLVEIDLAPFLETAALLYAGPWVAERAAAVGGFLASHPDSVWPTTRTVIETAGRFSAVDAFEGTYRLAELHARLRAGLAGDRRHCCCRRRRRSTGSPRSPPSRSCSTAGSAPTPTSSTCSTLPPWPCRPGSGRTACRSA